MSMSEYAYGILNWLGNRKSRNQEINGMNAFWHSPGMNALWHSPPTETDRVNLVLDPYSHAVNARIPFHFLCSASGSVTRYLGFASMSGG